MQVLVQITLLGRLAFSTRKPGSRVRRTVVPDARQRGRGSSRPAPPTQVGGWEARRLQPRRSRNTMHNVS